jgi:secreted trypsin-like serine protease
MWFACLAVFPTTASFAQNASTLEADARATSLEDELSYRIIGGAPAAKNAWPWQIALFLRSSNGQFHFQCGGSIIDHNWILTAAHCVYDDNKRTFIGAREFMVLEGVTKIGKTINQNRAGHKLKVAEVIGHANYAPERAYKNDIALLRLASPASSKPVVLSFPENTILEKPGTTVTVTGWGLIKPFDKKWKDFHTHEKIQAGDPRYFTDRLMEVALSLLDCQQVRPNSNIDHTQVCAGVPEGGKDSCRGDSGGPLVAREADGPYEQVGVVSYGFLECGAKGSTGVYSKVAAYESWIRSKTGVDFKRPGKPAAPPIVKPPITPPPPVKPTANNKAGLSIGFAQGNTLKPGQSIQFSASAQMSGHLVLIDFTPDGKATQIYPNRRSLSASKLSKSNRLEAGRQLIVPDPQNPYEGFEIKAEPPTGEGFLLAILSAKPLTSVALPDLPKTMEKPDSLDYMSNIIDELKRDLTLSTDTDAQSRPQDWSYVISPYRIVP